MIIYLLGSLRNPRVPIVGNILRAHGHDVFDDWFAAGEKADDEWQAYEQQRGHTLPQALDNYPAWHVFNYDDYHITRSDVMVMLTPAGKSCHMEFGVGVGRGKPGFILLHAIPERWDVMLRFADQVFIEEQGGLAALILALDGIKPKIA